MALAVSVFCASGAFADDCAFWGDFAITAQGDYEARLEAGQNDALERTKELIGYGDSAPGSMGHVYREAVVEGLKARLPRDDVFDLGKQVCLSYPVGTFDPDALD